MENKEMFKTAVTVVGIIAVYKLSQKLGIFKSADEILNENAETSPFNYWNKNEWKKLNWTDAKQQQVHSIALPVANTLANDIFGWFNDSFSIAFNALKEMKTQAEVSFLCDVFSYEFNNDLYQWLQNGNWTFGSGFGGADIAKINKYIKQLPIK